MKDFRHTPQLFFKQGDLGTSLPGPLPLSHLSGSYVLPFPLPPISFFGYFSSPRLSSHSPMPISAPTLPPALPPSLPPLPQAQARTCSAS